MWTSYKHISLTFRRVSYKNMNNVNEFTLLQFINTLFLCRLDHFIKKLFSIALKWSNLKNQPLQSLQELLIHNIQIPVS